MITVPQIQEALGCVSSQFPVLLVNPRWCAGALLFALVSGVISRTLKQKCQSCIQLVRNTTLACGRLVL